MKKKIRRMLILVFEVLEHPTHRHTFHITFFFPQVVAHCDMYAKRVRGGNNCCNNVGLRTNKKINIKAFCLRK